VFELELEEVSEFSCVSCDFCDCSCCSCSSNFFCSNRSFASLRYAWISVALRWFRLDAFFFFELFSWDEDKVDKEFKGREEEIVEESNGAGEEDDEEEEKEEKEDDEATDVESLYHWLNEPSHDWSELEVACRWQLWSSGNRWFTQTSFPQFLHGKRTCSGTWHPLAWLFFFSFSLLFLLLLVDTIWFAYVDPSKCRHCPYQYILS